MKQTSFASLLMMAFILLVSPSGFAGDEATAAAASTINQADIAWMIVATAFVMLMTPGLAFFYSGMVRSKNASSTIFQSFICLGIISIVWFVAGYSLAFGNSQGGFIGDFSYGFLFGVGEGPAPAASNIPHSLFMVFQCMFAIITPALITGAFAERIKFKTYLVFIVLWSLIVYSPLCHWVWGGGFMSQWGKLDFAGGTVVHMSAGLAALVAAIVIGKRVDHGKEDITPHNIPYICLGTALLWFGWFGFNAGSALASNEGAVRAFVTTHFAAAAAVLTWMFMDWMTKKTKPNLMGACIGAVVGLITITPGAGYVTVSSAVVIGAIGSFASHIVSHLIQKSNIDDALDVFGCHGMAGLAGVLLVGIFAEDGGGWDQFVIQAKSAVVATVYICAVTYILLKGLDVVMGLRPDEKKEILGLDEAEHSEKAYS